MFTRPLTALITTLTALTLCAAPAASANTCPTYRTELSSAPECSPPSVAFTPPANNYSPSYDVAFPYIPTDGGPSVLDPNFASNFLNSDLNDLGF